MKKKFKETELNGDEEVEDGMSDEEGDRIDVEEESAPPDGRVRAGPRKQTDPEGKRRTCSNTRAVRERLVHTLHDGQRAPHYTSPNKKKSQDRSRRPTITMDYYFMKMKPVVDTQTMAEESVTCIAVKEDRHQNIMSSVALKKGSRRTVDN